jgi:hypothetical protein
VNRVQNVKKEETKENKKTKKYREFLALLKPNSSFFGGQQESPFTESNIEAFEEEFKAVTEDFEYDKLFRKIREAKKRGGVRRSSGGNQRKPSGGNANQKPKPSVEVQKSRVTTETKATRKENASNGTQATRKENASNGTQPRRSLFGRFLTRKRVPIRTQNNQKPKPSANVQEARAATAGTQETRNNQKPKPSENVQEALNNTEALQAAQDIVGNAIEKVKKRAELRKTATEEDVINQFNKRINTNNNLITLKKEINEAILRKRKSQKTPRANTQPPMNKKPGFLSFFTRSRKIAPIGTQNNQGGNTAAQKVKKAMNEAVRKERQAFVNEVRSDKELLQEDRNRILGINSTNKAKLEFKKVKAQIKKDRLALLKALKTVNATSRKPVFTDELKNVFIRHYNNKTTHKEKSDVKLHVNEYIQTEREFQQLLGTKSRIDGRVLFTPKQKTNKFAIFRANTKTNRSQMLEALKREIANMHSLDFKEAVNKSIPGANNLKTRYNQSEDKASVVKEFKQIMPKKKWWRPSLWRGEAISKQLKIAKDLQNIEKLEFNAEKLLNKIKSGSGSPNNVRKLKEKLLEASGIAGRRVDPQERETGFSRRFRRIKNIVKEAEKEMSKKIVHKPENKQEPKPSMEVQEAMNIFGLQPGYAKQQLNSARRRIMLKVHPNRRADRKNYDRVERAYNLLLSENMRRQAEAKEEARGSNKERKKQKRELKINTTTTENVSKRVREKLKELKIQNFNFSKKTPIELETLEKRLEKIIELGNRLPNSINSRKEMINLSERNFKNEINMLMLKPTRAELIQKIKNLGNESTNLNGKTVSELEKYLKKKLDEKIKLVGEIRKLQKIIPGNPTNTDDFNSMKINNLQNLLETTKQQVRAAEPPTTNRLLTSLREKSNKLTNFDKLINRIQQLINSAKENQQVKTRYKYLKPVIRKIYEEYNGNKQKQKQIAKKEVELRNLIKIMEIKQAIKEPNPNFKNILSRINRINDSEMKQKLKAVTQMKEIIQTIKKPNPNFRNILSRINGINNDSGMKQRLKAKVNQMMREEAEQQRLAAEAKNVKKAAEAAEAVRKRRLEAEKMKVNIQREENIKAAMARTVQANADQERLTAEATAREQAELQARVKRAQETRATKAAANKAREAEKNRIAAERAAALGAKEAGRALEVNNSQVRAKVEKFGKRIIKSGATFTTSFEFRGTINKWSNMVKTGDNYKKYSYTTVDGKRKLLINVSEKEFEEDMKKFRPVVTESKRRLVQSRGLRIIKQGMSNELKFKFKNENNFKQNLKNAENLFKYTYTKNGTTKQISLVSPEVFDKDVPIKSKVNTGRKKEPPAKKSGQGQNGKEGPRALGLSTR